jgi:hypothetical protein
MRSSNGVWIGYLFLLASCVSETSNQNTRPAVVDGGAGTPNTGGRVIGTGGGATGGSGGGAGGSPSTGGSPPSCGGSVAIFCGSPHSGGSARMPALRATVGTDVGSLDAPLARICRNETCATIDVSVGVPAPVVLFGPGDRERIRMSITNEAGALLLDVAWVLVPTDPALKDGDVYSLRLLDASGNTVRFFRKSATYTRWQLAHGSCPPGSTTYEPCIDVELADVTGPDPGAPDANVEGGAPGDGSTAARCCPREPDPPPGDLTAPRDPFCFALGGPDLGGCYKTCAWRRASPDSSTCDAPARLETVRGCETWVATGLDGAAPVPGTCGQF